MQFFDRNCLEMQHADFLPGEITEITEKSRKRNGIQIDRITQYFLRAPD